MIVMEELLTSKEAAQALKVSEYTVIRRIKEGVLKASKIGGVWRISRTDLQAYVNSQSNQKK